MRYFGAPEKNRIMNRFFVGKENILDDEIIISDREDIHHITKVLRLKEGALCDISDSGEWEYRVRLVSFAGGEIRAKILDKQKFSSEPELMIALFQGVPKQGKMESIIQKSVELGVYCIVPVFMARTITVHNESFAKKIGRWQKVAAEAVKQCRRGIIPKVENEVTFSGMINLFDSERFDKILFAYENEKGRTIKDALRDIKEKPRSLAIAIGPEGGFSDEEAKSLEIAGGVSVSLGKTVLRTETAGPAAIAMAMYELEL